MLDCSITIDVDSLKAIFKGKDLNKPEGYTYLEYEIGMQNFLDIFDEFGIKATFFVVGEDLNHLPNRSIVQQAYNRGHEIANHTMNHTQGFRFLAEREKQKELEMCEAVIEASIGTKPVGFRSPGWNIGDNDISLMIQRGYQYDSSVFPTYLMPLLKFLHFVTMNSRAKIDRTTMGQMDYMFASPLPYQTDLNQLRKKGNSGFFEMPVSVTPITRIPFFATFHLATGLNMFKTSYKFIKAANRPIIYLFHLFDFVDFSLPDFEGQIPNSKGIYIPGSIRVSYKKKYRIFREILSLISKDYSFKTLQNMRSTL